MKHWIGALIFGILVRFGFFPLSKGRVIYPYLESWTTNSNIDWLEIIEQKDNEEALFVI